MATVPVQGVVNANAGRAAQTRVSTVQTVAAARVHVIGALTGVAMLKLVMLAALFTQTDPYPPLRFAPLFSASLALSVFAIALLMTRSRAFVIPVVAITLESLLSVGPHKLYPGESDMFAQTPAVYPVIVVGTALLIALAVSSVRLYRAWSEESRDA
jgi:hypothetical protein